jgi:hypothetical protein
MKKYMLLMSLPFLALACGDNDHQFAEFNRKMMKPAKKDESFLKLRNVKEKEETINYLIELANIAKKNTDPDLQIAMGAAYIGVLDSIFEKHETEIVVKSKYESGKDQKIDEFVSVAISAFKDSVSKENGAYVYKGLHELIRKFAAFLHHV